MRDKSRLLHERCSELLQPTKIFFGRANERHPSDRNFERSCNDATQVETTASRSEIAAISRALRYCHRGELHSSSGQQ